MDWRNYTDEADILSLIPDSMTYKLARGGEVVAPLKESGRVITKNLPVEVPLRYCKDKDYNGGIEALQCLGGGVIIGDHHFRPPSLGVFTMMEATNNPFPVDFTKCTVIQQYHILLFNELREKVLPLVIDWHQQDKEFNAEDETTYTSLDYAALAHSQSLEAEGVDLNSIDVWLKIIEMFNVCGNGFEMLPGGGSSKYWYCAESIGSIVTSLGADLNKSYEEIVWEIPLTLIGFCYVGKAKANGAKNVKRPKDTDDVRRQMILTYLRDKHGELHPWQIDRPKDHKLTEEQKKHPGCVKQFEKLKVS